MGCAIIGCATTDPLTTTIGGSGLVVDAIACCARETRKLGSNSDQLEAHGRELKTNKGPGANPGPESKNKAERESMAQKRSKAFNARINAGATR